MPPAPYSLAVAVVPGTDRYVVSATLAGADRQVRLEAHTQIRLNGEKYLAEIVANFVRVLRDWEKAIVVAMRSPNSLPARLTASELAHLAARCQPEVPRSISLRYYAENLVADWTLGGG